MASQALNLNSLILTSKTGHNTVASMASHQASSQLVWCSSRLYSRSFLFLIYMNDLPNSLENVEITMFADDTSLSKAFQNVDKLCMEFIPAFANICKWLVAIN